MAAIRVVKNKDYSIVHNGFINNKNLSFKAKGILLYFLSKPDTWDFYIKELAKNSRDGIEGIRSGINELEKNGYIHKKLKRDEHGKLSGGYDFIIYEQAQPKQESTETVKNQSGNLPNGENRSLINTELNSNTDNITISKDIVCGTEKSVPTENTPYEKIIDLFNSTCKSLPKVMARNKTRDKHIKTMYKTLGMDKIKKVFELTESSNYLSGRNNKWLNCSFDWVIKVSNYTKVLEGNYNRDSKVINMPVKRSDTPKQPVKINTKLLEDL